MSAHLLLRQRREARGLSLEEAAGATRIEARYLSAIEHGRLDQLPDGPKRRAWVLSYAAFLEVDPAQIASLVPPPERPKPGLAPGVVWGMSAVAIGLAVLLIGRQVKGWWDRPTPVDVPELARIERSEPDQHVKLRVVEAGRFKVWVDGELAVDERLDADQRLEFSAHDRVELQLPTAGSARVTYNGESIAPQGRQDEPRKLVFIDDVQAP